MTLHQVKAFVRIVELGSLTKAAGSLRVAQPALSRQLRQLEQELGHPLLVREARGVRTTAAGDAFFAHAQQVLASVRAAQYAVRAASSDPAGLVSVGVPSSLAESVLPQLVAQVRERYPRISLQLVDGYSSELHRRALNGDLDLSILYRDEAALAPLTWSRLLREELVFVTHDKDKEGQPIAPAGVKTEHLILPAFPSRLRALADAWMGNVKVRFEIDSVAALRAMVARGEGDTILPFSTVAAAVAEGALTVRPLSPPLFRELVLARRAGVSPSAGEEVVAALLMEATQHLPRRR